MAEQSNLTITGIGGDPSGSHPTGNLNKYWTETLDDGATRYTANNAMGPQLLIEAAGDDYVAYSKVLYLTNIPDGIFLALPTMAVDAQALGCWQWYNPSTLGVDADFAMAADGKTGSFGNGTWTDVNSPAVNFSDGTLDAYVGPDEILALRKGVALRMSLSIVDDGVDGVLQDVVDAAVAVINTGYVMVPTDAAADSNRPMVAAYNGQPVAGGIGGIGADPS